MVAGLYLKMNKLRSSPVLPSNQVWDYPKQMLIAVSLRCQTFYRLWAEIFFKTDQSHFNKIRDFRRKNKMGVYKFIF